MKIIICDDDVKFAETVREFCQKFFEQKNISGIELYVVESGERFLAIEEECDILLLDIEMDRVNGIEVKERLKEKNKNTRVVFLTSHTEYMKEAFGKYVYGFVEKKEYWKLGEFLPALVEEIREEQGMVFAENDGKIFSVKRREIYYIKADGNYLEIHTKEKVYLIREKIGVWEEKFRQKGFYRIQKSYLINFDYMKEVNQKKCTLTDGIKLPISRGSCRKVKDAYREFLKKK